MKEHLLAHVETDISQRRPNSEPAPKMSNTDLDRSLSLGIGCALIASTAFTLNDVGVKFLSGDYALHQIIFVRACFAFLLTLLIIIPLEGGFSLLRTKNIRLHIFRGLAVVLANMSFFMGLAAMPLAEATAIFFVSPLVITAFSVFFLKEKVGPWRWFAVAAGLFGAIVIIRPGTQAFQLAALLPIFAAVCYASLHMMTRKIGKTEKASTLAIYTQFVFLVASATIGLAFGSGEYATDIHPSIEFLTRAWVWPSTGDFLIMLCNGVTSATGGYMISQAYRQCEAAVIAPFEYVALVLAIIWGILIFSEWPDNFAWTGITLIFASGLLVLWREAVLKKRVANQRPMPRVR